MGNVGVTYRYDKHNRQVAQDYFWEQIFKIEYEQDCPIRNFFDGVVDFA